MAVNVHGAEQALIETQDKRIEELEGAVKYYRKRYRAECDVHDNLKIEAGKLEAQVAALEARNKELESCMTTPRIEDVDQISKLQAQVAEEQEFKQGYYDGGRILMKEVKRLLEQVAALEALLRKAAEGTWWDGNEPFTIQRLESWIAAALQENE